uniref:Uncharacterized protein n=1 Tax=Tanacetum cinerariifolium TaxID=118510 RepID=A0A6L2K704_TANCI|nr:hypothetical protein [Tanacetum cinerariifolium]
MSSITAQQTKLDLELVPKEKRFDIGKCNGIIPSGLKPREPTFQVVLDALALTPCYSAFLITTDICPRVQGQDFDALPSEEDTVSFLRELIHTRAYNMYLGFASGVVPPKIARKFKKASPSKKDSSLVPVDDEPAKKGKRVERPDKKSTTTPATGIVISEAPVETQLIGGFCYI